jgi:hypothetical protein
MSGVTASPCERRNDYDRDVTEARALAARTRYERCRPTRLRDPQGRVYYPSWLAACDGSMELLGVLGDVLRDAGRRVTTQALRDAYRVAKEMGRHDVVPRDCETCGERFTPTANATTARYCSNACRQRAYRRRQAESR